MNVDDFLDHVGHFRRRRNERPMTFAELVRLPWLPPRLT